MTTYVIGTLEVTDPQPLEEYGRRVGPIVEQHGGRFLAVGPVTHHIEGDPAPTMVALIAFDDADAALRWYHSTDYTTIRHLRQNSGHTRVLLIDGT
ncbi:MAG: DUF1330 domain-containing protein [Acidimicrobiales bacterium]